MDCPQIPSTSYNEFSSAFHDRILREQIPTDGTFELTFRCNLNCRHCYCSQSSEKELTTNEVFRIIDEIADQGCLWLLLTGGEPLVRADFARIYTYAKKKGILVTLFTNGTLITKEIVDLLKDLPPFLVEITIYGFSQESYQEITQSKGSFAKALGGIDLLLNAKIPLQLKTMAMKANYREIGAMRSFAQSLGLQFRIDSYIHPQINGDLGPCNTRLSPEKVVEVDFIDPRRVAKFKQSYFEFEPHPGSSLVYNCGAGIDNFSINPYGFLQLCQMVNYPAFDLRQGSFAQGWKEFIPKMRSLTTSHNGECSECRLRPLCGYCPAWANLEAGNHKQPIEYLCQVARLREERFDLKSKKEVNHEAKV